MSQTAYATAADYADALLTARRAKNALFLLLFICLLGQLALFFTARFSNLIVTAPDAPLFTPMTVPATGPAVDIDVNVPDGFETKVAAAASQLSAGPVKFVPTKSGQLLQYANGLTGYVGLVSTLVLGVVLLLIVAIMLVGRLVGVAGVTSAFIWTTVLLLMLFPWQAFLNNNGLTGVEFKIPGVLYTWDELISFAKFQSGLTTEAFFKWSRFVGFPVVALILLMVIQTRSSRGLKQALGEETPVTPTA